MSLSTELKNRLTNHIEEDFESSMEGKSVDDLDGMYDSISSGLINFQPEMDKMSTDEMDEFLTFVEETVNRLCEEWEEEEEED